MSQQKVDTSAADLATANRLRTLQDMGPRAALQNLGETVSADYNMKTDALERQLQRGIEGTQNLASARQNVLDQIADVKRSNVDRRLGFAESQKDMYADAAQQAAQNQAQAVADRRGGLNNLIGGGLQFLGQTDFIQDMFAEDGGKFYEDGGLAKLAPPFDKVTYADVLRGRGVPAKGEYGIKMPGGGVMAQILQSRGDMPPVQGPLPGEASHDTNPMHVMDSNGEKHAELMGEEFIINSDHANELTAEHRDIKEVIESGKTPTQEEWMRFFETVDGIFSQPQFQDNVA